MKSLIGEFDKEKELAKIKEKERESGDIINRIFNKLKLIFPAWRQNFKTEKDYLDTKALWLETLIEEKITTQEQIELGLKGAKNHNSPFFPSIGQFIHWTKKEKPRINEQAYQPYIHKLGVHTQAELEEYATKGMKNLRTSLGMPRKPRTPQ